MSGPNSIQRTTARSIQPPPMRPNPDPQPQPTASDVRDGASATVHQMQSATPVRNRGRMSMQQAVDALAQTYSDGGIHAVNGALRSNPALVAALGGHTHDSVEAALDEKPLGWGASSAIVGAVQQEVTATLRRAVMADADTRIHQHVQRMGAEQTRLRTERQGLGDPPSDPQRATQLDQAIEVLDESMDNLQALQTRFQGQAWEVGDFEQVAARASLRMGMGAGTHGTFVRIGLNERSDQAESAAHYTSVAAELGVELPHVIHAGIISLPAAILAGGIIAGALIHHAASEHRQEFIGVAHQLGIR